jgi:hypothetical protein
MTSNVAKAVSAVNPSGPFYARFRRTPQTEMRMADHEGTTDAERSNRNRGLEEAEKRQRERHGRSPHRAAEQEHPEQERSATPDEKSDQDIAQLENPPQSEGPRERSNNGV